MYRVFQSEKKYFKVTAFYALSLAKYHMKCHAHESFEIMYVTSGECRIFRNAFRCRRDILLQMAET